VPYAETATTSPQRGLSYPSQLLDAYVFDLDGTIYLGEGLLPGAKRLVETLRDEGRIVRFLSNNPTKDVEEYADKLERLGLPTPEDEIVNTIVTTTQWLLDHAPDAVVFPMGSDALIRALDAAGIRMSRDPAEIDIVLASYDRTFNYEKLQIAFDAIWFHRRARLIGTNPDRYCPFPGGRGEPDCASVIAAVEACTGTTCELTVGKPDPAMLEATLSGLHVAPERTVMVGDRLMTDLEMARRAGVVGALVLTGDTQPEELEDLPEDRMPPIVLDRVDRLLPADIWEERGWEESDT
jgi:HAD superfamily hydrolase (TIGR01450 family)